MGWTLDPGVPIMVGCEHCLKEVSLFEAIKEHPDAHFCSDTCANDYYYGEEEEEEE